MRAIDNLQRLIGRIPLKRKQNNELLDLGRYGINLVLDGKHASFIDWSDEINGKYNKDPNLNMIKCDYIPRPQRFISWVNEQTISEPLKEFKATGLTVISIKMDLISQNQIIKNSYLPMKESESTIMCMLNANIHPQLALEDESTSSILKDNIYALGPLGLISVIQTKLGLILYKG